MIYNLSTKVSFIQKFYRLSLNLSKNLSFVPKPVPKSSFIIYPQKYRLSENSIVYPGNLSFTQKINSIVLYGIYTEFVEKWWNPSIKIGIAIWGDSTMAEGSA